ncbi:hypothetical protein [Nakamurella sp. PAMC28650]|uniref:hypothetical protein n=1 Tax=Nakamurella sp. PAMC28650 TaxID=2762325 RepID=UPI00164E2456|nr:hypothetical protein [Nakamurella sp. PAMC28650]QNK81146.1 hypothetical protein H7F38_24360 [Nakamurella sp. PAMC28650]
MNRTDRMIRTFGGLTIGVLTILALAACGTTVAGQQSLGTASGGASASLSALGSTPVSGAAAGETLGSATASVALSTMIPAAANSTTETSTTQTSTTPTSSTATADGVTTTRRSQSGGGSGGGSGSSGGSGGGGSGSSSNPRFVSASAGCVLSSDDGTYHLIVSWELANATGLALSVDNPGLVGSYGTYTWHGSQDLSELGCYQGDRTQDIELYSVGGTGPRAKKSFHIHEDHQRITPPPFASGAMPTHIPPAVSAPVTSGP